MTKTTMRFWRCWPRLERRRAPSPSGVKKKRDSIRDVEISSIIMRPCIIPYDIQYDYDYRMIPIIYAEA